ncbi:ATP-dependent helicase [Brevifollis gellanilyticus]|uniref:DNA 3'-5' helicase n=1 Tax=Brevifollis gellanilyticus TaxID=748831 RepID=A0A512M882_9BACT|nr:UvrD-helicase domain-containing protein [Brevifollis gellanilyticus]GEP42551.1 DNA helicase [Brevifollis gellanilyticus]
MSGFTGTLNPQQRQAATHIHGPLLILAGAGTGKTRVVTARIAYMINEGIKPENILAVTFTNKAATEMRERVKDMCRGDAGKKVGVGTFHAFCARLLREFAPYVGYKQNFVIYSQGEQISLMKRAMKDLLIKEETLDPQAVLTKISKAKNYGESLGDPQMDLTAAVGEKYQNEMRALNAMDFDDLLCLGVQLLENHADVRSVLHRRHKFLMVDEFQDTNSLQMRLLRALVPAPYNVCVVGDDDQSIYGWRGAEITNITEFENFFENPTVVKLEENYRSTTPILHTANSLIVNNAGRRPKSLWSRNAGSAPVRIIAVQDDKEEADMVSKEIERAHFADKEPFENFAVLFRTNDQSRVLEQAFRAKKIAYRVIGARSFFDRREVKDILAYLTILHNPHDDISLLRVLNTPTRGIGTTTAELARERSMEKFHSVWVALCDEDFLRQIPEKARTAIRTFTALISKYAASAQTQGVILADLTEHLILELGYREYLQKLAKKPEEYNSWDNGLSEFMNQISRYQERNNKEGLAGFLDEVTLGDDREEKDDIEKKKGVCLITMHASKGLEFPIVYLPGLEQGILPHKRSYDEGRVDEERRLFYVGITRARLKLTISFVRTRMKWGKPQTELPSPFLKELDRTYVEDIDYTQHMKEAVGQEETTNFFAGLKAMLSSDQP